MKSFLQGFTKADGKNIIRHSNYVTILQGGTALRGGRNSAVLLFLFYKLFQTHTHTHRIPCSYRKICSGWMGWSDFYKGPRTYQTHKNLAAEKSVVDDHSITTNHINFEDSFFLRSLVDIMTEWSYKP